MSLNTRSGGRVKKKMTWYCRILPTCTLITYYVTSYHIGVASLRPLHDNHRPLYHNSDTNSIMKAKEIVRIPQTFTTSYQLVLTKELLFLSRVE